MASTCSIYKHGILLGTGSCSDGSASITSFSATSGAPSVVKGKNIEVVITQAGTHAGRSWRSRVAANNGAGTVTLDSACPYVSA
jgi:ribosomal protein S1